jgi:hypothetical protein
MTSCLLRTGKAGGFIQAGAGSECLVVGLLQHLGRSAHRREAAVAAQSLEPEGGWNVKPILETRA